MKKTNKTKKYDGHLTLQETKYNNSNLRKLLLGCT